MRSGVLGSSGYAKGTTVVFIKLIYNLSVYFNNNKNNNNKKINNINNMPRIIFKGDQRRT